MELVPLQVKIGLDSKNFHKFPDFNTLSSVVRDGVDWSVFIDRFGGWHYDQVCGHAQEDITSARGNWNGMLMVPDNFAQAAVAAFPDECFILTELDATDFYDTRGHVRDPAIKEDARVLQSIKAKVDLGIEQTQDDVDALDPEHPSPGRRNNPKKTFAGFKTDQGITVAE